MAVADLLPGCDIGHTKFSNRMQEDILYSIKDILTKALFPILNVDSLMSSEDTIHLYVSSVDRNLQLPFHEE